MEIVEKEESPCKVYRVKGRERERTRFREFIVCSWDIRQLITAHAHIMLIQNRHELSEIRDEQIIMVG